MNPSELMEQLISVLLEQDAKIKSLFYAHINNEPCALDFHYLHHTIKRWVKELSVIRSEMNNILFTDEFITSELNNRKATGRRGRRPLQLYV